MTREHKFGGKWTVEKLERIRKYLRAYTTIFKGNERARHLRTTYVDAFAGSGHRVPSDSQRSRRNCADEAEKQNLRPSTTKDRGSLPPVGRMSLTSTVPAVVPSLRQSSKPVAPSLAKNSTVLPST